MFSPTYIQYIVKSMKLKKLHYIRMYQNWVVYNRIKRKRKIDKHPNLAKGRKTLMPMIVGALGTTPMILRKCLMVEKVRGRTDNYVLFLMGHPSRY